MMILTILLISIVLAVAGFILYDKLHCGDDWIGTTLASIGVIVGVITLVIAMILGICVIDVAKVDEKIAMYQEENAKIEVQIATTVENYQQYENNIFTEVTPDSSITLVALYPELKSDKLVESQIEVYIANNEKIKSLKEAKINGSVYRWWLYFGG
jgi:hypothetical protein